MIAVVSPDYLRRARTTVERHTALLPDSHDGEVYLVPVVVEPCTEALPRMFSVLVPIDLSGLDDEDEARRRLLGGLTAPGSRRGRAGRTSPAGGRGRPFPGT
jgi:hypothetical protein